MHSISGELLGNSYGELPVVSHYCGFVAELEFAFHNYQAIESKRARDYGMRDLTHGTE